MRGLALIIALAAIVITSATTNAKPAATEDNPVQCEQCSKPRIDAVFLIDTTGSMSGLIEGAKVKIWSIATEMLQAEIVPELRIGLIGYRDRGDAYVTRRFDLTADIDDIYSELIKFRAQGGGDRPESVNQALHDALKRMSWDRNPQTYRVVFLVGDSPPKMTYQDDVKYPVTARQARKDNVIINTVLAGGASDTKAIWQQIANLAGGQFAAIPQSGNMRVIKTPFDGDIQQLQRRLHRTIVPYGDQSRRNRVRQKSKETTEAPSAVQADKSAYLRAKGYSLGSRNRRRRIAQRPGDRQSQTRRNKGARPAVRPAIEKPSGTASAYRKASGRTQGNQYDPRPSQCPTSRIYC